MVPDCGVHNSLQILLKNLELVRKERCFFVDSSVTIMQILRTGVFYFIVVFGAGFVLGTIRTLTKAVGFQFFNKAAPGILLQ